MSRPFDRAVVVKGWGTEPMLKRPVLLLKFAGVLMVRGTLSTQFLHLGLFGGQAVGMGLMGHCVRFPAISMALVVRTVICFGSGLRTAMPLSKTLCQVVWR